MKPCLLSNATNRNLILIVTLMNGLPYTKSLCAVNFLNSIWFEVVLSNANKKRIFAPNLVLLIQFRRNQLRRPNRKEEEKCKVNPSVRVYSVATQKRRIHVVHWRIMNVGQCRILEEDNPNTVYAVSSFNC